MSNPSDTSGILPAMTLAKNYPGASRADDRDNALAAAAADSLYREYLKEKESFADRVELESGAPRRVALILESSFRTGQTVSQSFVKSVVQEMETQDRALEAVRKWREDPSIMRMGALDEDEADDLSGTGVYREFLEYLRGDVSPAIRAETVAWFETYVQSGHALVDAVAARKVAKGLKVDGLSESQAALSAVYGGEGVGLAESAEIFMARLSDLGLVISVSQVDAVSPEFSGRQVQVARVTSMKPSIGYLAGSGVVDVAMEDVVNPSHLHVAHVTSLDVARSQHQQPVRFATGIENTMKYGRLVNPVTGVSYRSAEHTLFHKCLVFTDMEAKWQWRAGLVDGLGFADRQAINTMGRMTSFRGLSSDLAPSIGSLSLALKIGQRSFGAKSPAGPATVTAFCRSVARACRALGKVDHAEWGRRVNYGDTLDAMADAINLVSENVPPGAASRRLVQDSLTHLDDLLSGIRHVDKHRESAKMLKRAMVSLRAEMELDMVPPLPDREIELTVIANTDVPASTPTRKMGKR